MERASGCGKQVPISAFMGGSTLGQARRMRAMKISSIAAENGNLQMLCRTWVRTSEKQVARTPGLTRTIINHHAQGASTGCKYTFTKS